MRRGPFKQLIATVGGSGERAVMSAAFMMTLTFVATGHGWSLAVAFLHCALFASGFLVVGYVLAFAACLAGVADDDPRVRTKAPARKPASTDEPF